MKSLKEISRELTIKYGVGPRGVIPENLREELERIESDIQRTMTGRFHLHRNAWVMEDIEIFWERRRQDRTNGGDWSQWRFLNHVTGTSAVIRADESVAVSPLIADVFQLEPLTSISVSFDIDFQDTTVTFRGTYVPDSKGAPVTEFVTTFSFRESNGSLETVTEVTRSDYLYYVFKEVYNRTESFSPHFCSTCGFPWS